MIKLTKYIVICLGLFLGVEAHSSSEIHELICFPQTHTNCRVRLTVSRKLVKAFMENNKRFAIKYNDRPVLNVMNFTQRFASARLDKVYIEGELEGKWLVSEHYRSYLVSTHLPNLNLTVKKKRPPPPEPKKYFVLQGAFHQVYYAHGYESAVNDYASNYGESTLLADFGGLKAVAHLEGHTHQKSSKEDFHLGVGEIVVQPLHWLAVSPYGKAEVGTHSAGFDWLSLGGGLTGVVSASNVLRIDTISLRIKAEMGNKYYQGKLVELNKVNDNEGEEKTKIDQIEPSTYQLFDIRPSIRVNSYFGIEQRSIVMKEEVPAYYLNEQARIAEVTDYEGDYVSSAEYKLLFYPVNFFSISYSYTQHYSEIFSKAPPSNRPISVQKFSLNLAVVF